MNGPIGFPAESHKGHAAARNLIRLMNGPPGIERMEARLHGQAFSPHRHDTYAVGVTLSGVQTFRFRGRRWYCLPGDCHILHPDELHDGGAATDSGFSYRIVYVDPSLVHAALDHCPLPFVAEPVLQRQQFPDDGLFEIWDFDRDMDEPDQVDLVTAVSRLLIGAAHGAPSSGSPRLHLSGLRRVRDLIASCPSERQSMEELEAVAGLDRWTLARQFRAVFGTSPRRFRILRQLDHVRHLLRTGTTLAQASVEAGFADQSHMSRQFKVAYGSTPAKWLASLVQDHGRLANGLVVPGSDGVAE